MTRLVLTVLGMLALGSCRQDDGPAPAGSDADVLFGAYVSTQPESRASVADINTLKRTGFGVFAIQSGNDDYNPDASAGLTPGFMYNQKVVWSTIGGNGAWTYEPRKSWTSSKLSFFAYAPYTSGGGKTGIVTLSGPQDTGSPKLSFRTDSNVDSQTDLLFADASSTVNLVNGGQVQLVFRHALSRVSLRYAVDELADPDSHVTVNRIVFKTGELAVAGDLDLYAGRWENLVRKEMTFAFSAESDFADLSNKTSDAFASTPSPLSAKGKYLMLIPSEDKVTVELSIDYDVTTADNRLEGGSITVSNSQTTRLNHHFEMGKAYDFTLRIGMDAIVTGVEVAEWDNWDSDWKPEEKK